MIDHRLDPVADSFGRVAGLAVNRLDGRGEEEFQLEHTARRGHVFVRGDAADGRLMHADRIGHGLEVISSYGKYLHGEAISIGQVAAAKISKQCTGLTAQDFARMVSLFEQAGLPTQIKLTALQTKQLFAAMQRDKKVSGGKIKFVLAKRIGQVVSGQIVAPAIIRQSLQQ